MAKKEVREFSPDELEARRRGLVELAEILETTGVKYLLLDGALLGAVRDKAFIPWDWDVDIGIYAESAEGKVWKLLDRASDAGFRVKLVRFGYMRLDLEKNGAEFTLQFYYEEGSLRRAGVIIHPREFFDATAEIDFLGRRYPCPKDKEKMLAHQYGLDWQIPKKVGEGTPMDRYIAKECFKRDPLRKRIARRLIKILQRLA